MSASRERKKRLEQAQNPVEVKETKKKKLSEGWIFAISVILVVALVFGCLFGYRAYQNNRTVLTVGDHEVSVSEFNFFYNSVVNNVASYASYVGIDGTLPLDEQKVAESGVGMLGLFGIDSSFLADETPVDGYYNMTWAQLFGRVAKENAATVYAIYNEAMEVGFEFTEEMEAEVDANIEQMQGYADENGESLNSLLERVFGAGCTKGAYRDFLEVQAVASHYPGELRYTEAELAARYEESPEDYDVATYSLYTASGSDYVEAAEDGTTPEPTDADTAKAKADAEAMEKAFDAENEKVSVKADSNRAAVTSAVTEEAAAWLFDEAADGDVKLFEKEGTYYVLQLTDKINYATMNALELVIAADHEHDEGEELDHVHEEGELTAAEKLELVLAALEADPTEETFRQLIEEYSSNTNGTVENMTRATMVSVSEEILAWSKEELKVGDYKVFEVDGATLILFYTGEGMSYADTTVTGVLANEHLEEISNAAIEACGYDEEAAMKGHVGLVLGTSEQ